LTPRRIQTPHHGISSSWRQSSCSSMWTTSSSKCTGFSLASARGLFLEANSGSARGSIDCSAAAVCTGGYHLARSVSNGCKCGGWKTLRVSASIYKSTGGAATARWICIGSRFSGGRLTFQLPVVDALHLGGSSTSTQFPGWRQDSRATQDTFYNQDDPSIQRKYSTQGSGAPCHVSFGFFSGFCGIILPELQMDPQPESTTQPKAWRLLHMECDFAIALPYKSQLQDNASIIEDLKEENLRTLGNYSIRLPDYSRISWSTFQPWDASSTLEDFWLVVLGDARGLLVKAVKTTRNYPARLQSTRGLVVWTSLGPQPRWVPGPTTWWAIGTTQLVPHGT
jgi:hypothetical protein